MSKIPYGRHVIDQQDINAVVNILQSSNLTQGTTVPAFEQALSKKVNAKHAVSFSSATAALHIACLALELSNDDIGWTVPLTFAASANVMRYCGAHVDFVDINPNTGCICIDALAEKLAIAASNNKLPKVLIVVHYSGISCDMEQIAKLCQPYSIRIIEDASHALGGYYQNAPVGNCKHSDCTVFSFHPVKIITSAEGGMITTNNQALAQRCRLLSSHGITKEQLTTETQTNTPWVYDQLALGFNYRLSDLHAALGLSQLEKLAKFVFARQQQADIYNEQLADLPIRTLSVPSGVASAWHIYVIQLTDGAGISRQSLYHQLHKVDIGTQVHYIPVHTLSYYQQLGFKKGQFPNAEQFSENCLTLPLYPTFEQQDKVIKELRTILQ